ncbi:uncharacterized protein LOC134255609 [Saccostrea cucullata]|uniref:uncharacterized protein LOC134255609 n=1 Tax=Saccostrea cuccullata TaxID=36930 RepID=UPI002ED32C4A
MSGKRGPKVKLTDSERKRRKKERNVTVNKCRISIGDQIERWDELKNQFAIENNAEMAKVLLDCYAEKNSGNQTTFKTNDRGKFVPHGTSTPAPCKIARRDSESEISILSTDEFKKREESEISGIEDIDSVGATSSSRKISCRPFSSSFLDPFDLTVYSSEVQDDIDDAVDDDYEPSFHLSLRLDHGILPSESEDEEDEDNIQDTEQEVELGPNIKRLRTNDEIGTLLEDHPVLVNTQQLMELARTTVPTICKVKGCGDIVQMNLQTVSSAVYLKWVCGKGHTANKWSSQPLLNRGLHSTDVLISAALIASGNNFQKMAMFAKFLKLPFPSQTSFCKMQRTYALPSIDQKWEIHQNEIMNEFQGKNLVILGDGRMDSPGHSAQFCTYTFMENTTHKILHIVVMDKRMTGGKSAVLFSERITISS